MTTSDQNQENLEKDDPAAVIRDNSRESGTSGSDSPNRSDTPKVGQNSGQADEPGVEQDAEPLETNAELLETDIEKLVTGGAGLGRCDGLATFVPYTAPGDRVRARVQRRKKGFVEAELVEILTPSPHRQEPPCPHFGNCGGCDFQHLTVEAQRQAKADIVADCFQRLGKLDITGILTGPDPVGPELGYRNKIRLFANPAGHYGLMRRASHDVVPLETCLLMPDIFTEEILPWLRQLPPLEQIVVRFDGRGGWLISLFGRPNRSRLVKQMIAGLPPNKAPLPGCRGILFNNLPVWGRDYLVIHVSGKKYRVASQNFFQTNLVEAEAAVTLTRTWLEESRAVGGWLADLYCGVGLLTLALADRFDKIVSVDSDSHAIHDARNNVKRDRTARGKATVIVDRISKYLSSTLTDENADPNTGAVSTGGGFPLPTPEQWRDACCVVDPPRIGLGARALAALIKLSPQDIIYMSCDPATLARDTALLIKAGYEPRKLRVFDMFPQTAHLEVLLQLVRS